MMMLEDLFINLLFAIGMLFLGVYVLAWLLSPKLRREIEAPKFRFQEQLETEEVREPPR